jgi:hypothetical protein
MQTIEITGCKAGTHRINAGKNLTARNQDRIDERNIQAVINHRVAQAK